MSKNPILRPARRWVQEAGQAAIAILERAQAIGAHGELELDLVLGQEIQHERDVEQQLGADLAGIVPAGGVPVDASVGLQRVRTAGLSGDGGIGSRLRLRLVLPQQAPKDT